MRSIRAVRTARWRAPGNSGQLFPISAARATSRRCADRIRKLCRLVDAAGIAKPMARSAGHQLLDLRGGDAQSGRSLGPMSGDQRARDIVAVARALFDGIARRYAVAVAIIQQPGEQPGLVSAGASVATGGIASEPRLNRIPKRLIDDRNVLAGMALALVNDLPAIDAVLQDQVERAARERLAADHPTRDARP